MHVNLYVKIGRAERAPVGTYADENEARAAQGVKSAELDRAGVARDRVSFSTETVGKGKGK